jgi:ParB family chromosome partitioning protein
MSSAEDRQRRLGKGLSALLPARGAASPAQIAPPTQPAGEQPPSRLPVDAIHPNPDQPRDVFDPGRLEELANSIRAHGIIQPIVVRRTGQGYQIIAGERRWRAAKLAGLKEVPVVVQEVADRELLEVALIENIQREDLNPIETAQAFSRLAHELGLSHEEIGRRTGKDRATISNFLRLLRLPRPVQELLADRKLSMGHAKAILSLHSPDDQIALANRAVAQGLSVRQVERQAQAITGDAPERASRSLPEDPNLRAAVEALERALGTRVKIVPANEQRGHIEIQYYSPADLDRLYARLVGAE